MKRQNWHDSHPPACTCVKCESKYLRTNPHANQYESWPSRRSKKPRRRRRRRRHRIRVPWVFIGIAVAIVGWMVWSDTGGAQEAVSGLWSSTTGKVSEVMSSEPAPPPTRREVLRRADDLSTLWWALALSPSVADCQEALRIVLAWRNEMEEKYGPFAPVDIFDVLDANFLRKAAQQGLDRGVGTREMWERLDDFDNLIKRVDRAC